MAAAKPVVGINGDFRAARKDGCALSWFNTGYYDCVTAAGGLPLLVPPLADDKDLKQFLDQLDGLVLAGCTQVYRVNTNPLAMSTRAAAASGRTPVGEVSGHYCNQFIIIIPIFGNPTKTFDRMMDDAEGQGGIGVVDVKLEMTDMLLLPLYAKACFTMSGTAVK